MAVPTNDEFHHADSAAVKATPAHIQPTNNKKALMISSA
jgi:hypothetical protein